MNAAAGRWGIALALALYALGGALLIAQKPGLHYDEALLVEGAVQMRHSRAEITLAHSPFTWTCKRGRCFPVMGEGPYIGAVKDYICLPLFAVFGTHAWVSRFSAMLLAMVGIWGFGRLIAQQVAPLAGAAAALVLAVNPAYLNMTVFDNGVVAPMMAGLGLICAAVAWYVDRGTGWAAFAIGAAAGFAIWARANFLWTLVAAAIAALIVFHRHLRIPLTHVLGMAVGGIVGGAPLLYYEYKSGGGTFQTMQDYAVQESLLQLLPRRLFWLADTLLSDGEHRVMWGMEQLPRWQLWLFPVVVLVAAVVCLLTFSAGDRRAWRAAPFAAIALVLSGGFLFTSHLPITEHHLIALVPLAVAVVVVACAFLQRWRWGALVSGALALVYLACAGTWQFASVLGLHRTGGIGVWSNAMGDLGSYLDREYSGREIKIMDWGFQTNLFVLMDGRLNSVELPGEKPDRSVRGRTWPEEIQEGGVFLLSGRHARTFAAPVENFLHAWADARPVTRIQRFPEGDGSTYAEILEIEPHSIQPRPAVSTERHQTLAMNDPAVDRLASGFFELQPAGWRWSKPEFSVSLDGPDLPGSPAVLSLDGFLPEPNVEKLGAISVSASIGGHALTPETYRQAGQFTFTRQVPGDWLRPGLNTFEFHVDKAMGPGPGNPRALGIVVSAVSLEAW